VSFAAPALLWLLVVPLALFLARSNAERRRATALVELWSPGRSEDAARAWRPRLDWSTVWLPLSLALLVLASAGPRASSARERWQVHVDARPSMLLVEDGATRLESALRACETWLAARGAEADWRIDGRVVASGARFDRSAAPPRVRQQARFDAPDAVGALWVVDRLPAAPSFAGAFVAARGVQPGLVERWSSDGRVHERVFDGVGVRIEPTGAPASCVVVDAGLPSVLVEFLRAWSVERGLEPRLRDGSAPAAATIDGEVVLEARLAPPGASRRLRFEEQGVELSGIARATLGGRISARSELEHAGIVLCASEPGIAWFAFEELSLSGSLEAFGARLARILDESRVACSGCVPLEGRAGAGASLQVEPARPPDSDAFELQWLFLVAALAALWPAWRRG
jgi:hypothetical protein